MNAGMVLVAGMQQVCMVQVFGGPTFGLLVGNSMVGHEDFGIHGIIHEVQGMMQLFEDEWRCLMKRLKKKHA